MSELQIEAKQRKELFGADAKVVTIDPAAIKKDWRARQDYGDVDGLAESIKSETQLQPVLVKKSVKEPDKFVIIAGMRRVRACRQLGIPVKAIVVEPSGELEALDLQLTENIMRKDFDVLETGEGLKRRKELYLKLHPETGKGATGRGRPKDSTVDRFTLATAKKMGVSESKVIEMLQIADLAPEKKEKIEKAPTSKARSDQARAALREERQERREKKLEQKAVEKQKERAKAKPAHEPPPAKKGAKKAEEKPAPPVTLFACDYRKVIGKVEVPLKSVDLVLTDPPYDRARSLIAHASRKPINESIPWDKLDVGWVLKVAPLLDKGGQILAFCPAEAIGEYERAFTAAKLKYRGHLAIHKTNPGVAHRSTYLSSMEYVVWACKDDGPTFKPFANAGAPEAHNFRETPVCGGNERLAHPTQKPLALIVDLLQRHSSPGDVVFDPFAGTGTTLVACKQHERAGLGCEIEPKYVKLATLRLEAV